MTTAIWCCGGECGLLATATTNVGQHILVNALSVGPWSVSTTTVRNGARALRYAPSAQNVIVLCIGTNAAVTTKVWRVAVRFATLPDVDCFISSYGYSTTQAGLGFQASDSTLRSLVSLAGVKTFGSSGTTITTGVWYVVDVKTVGNVVTGTVDVQVDGSAVAQVAGAFAAANTDTSLQLAGLGSITADIFYDDIVLSETAGDYPLGNGYVYAYVPTSDGTHNVASAGDFDRTLTGTDITNSTTDAYLLVDTVPFIATDISADTCITITAPPNATDYVQCVFGPAPGSSTAVDTVHGVEILGALQTASAGGSPTMDISLRINDGGTTGDIFTSSVFYNPSTPIFKRAHFATAPSSGTAWTATKVNALEARFGSFDAADSAPDGYFGTIMAEVAFISVTVTPEQKNWIRTGHVQNMYGVRPGRIFGRSW